MRWRLLGAAIVVMGALIARFAYPFVTYVAFAFFAGGVILVGVGVYLAAKGDSDARS